MDWQAMRKRARSIAPPAKTAIGAGVSWWLAVLLFGTHQPYFAPLAAILTMQVTVSESVTFGAQRILGVIGGIAVSLAAAHWLRPGALGVGLLVFAGMGLSTLVGLANRTVAQVGISGLLVLALGNRPEYAAARLVETVLGAVVGVLVEALVVPADPVPAARDAVATLAKEVSSTLRRIAEPRETREDTERLGRRAEAAHAAVSLALRSLVYSPLLRWRRRETSELRAALDALETAADAVRGIAASLGTLAPDDARQLPGTVLAQAAQAVEQFGDYVQQPSDRGAARLGATVRRLGRLAARSLTLLAPPRRGEVRRELGSVLSEVERLRREIARAKRRLVEV